MWSNAFRNVVLNVEFGEFLSRIQSGLLEISTQSVDVIDVFAGSQMLVLRSQSAHPLDPLSPTEIAVAIATVRAAGETPEVSVQELTRPLPRPLLFQLRVRFVYVS